MVRAQPDEFLIEVGRPESILPGDRQFAEEAVRARGLTIKELTLKKSFESWPEAFLWGANEIFFVTTALDMSGAAPFVYPEKPDDAPKVWHSIREGQTLKFTLGAGLPLFPTRPVAGGIAATVIVGEVDDHKALAKQLSAAADALKTDTSLTALLVKIAANPAGVAVDTVLGVVGKATDVIAKMLEADGNENVGLFRGFFPASGSWEGMLEQKTEAADIRLGELTEETEPQQ